MSCVKEMPKYQSHKQVWALKIKEIKFNAGIDNGATIFPEEEGYSEFKVDDAYMRKHDPKIGGYFVLYEDGYQSFSPARVFEEGNSLIVPEQKFNWAPDKNSTGEKVTAILNDESLTNAGKCVEIAEVYANKEYVSSVKLSCLNMASGSDKGIKEAKEMFRWVME